MATRREAKDARYRLKAGIARAEKLRARSLEQLCDGDVNRADRTTAEIGFNRARSLIAELEPLLSRLNRMMDHQG